MNTPSPLVPQGTSPDRGKTHLLFKILMILTVHVVVIGGLLLQGCKDTKSTTPETTANPDQTTNNPGDLSTLPPVTNNYAPAVPPGTNPGIAATPGTTPLPGTNPMANTTLPMAQPITPPITQPAAPATTDYVIARGDTLAKIAKKNGVSLKTLTDANPGVDARKLRIGAKLQIPGSASAPLAGDVSGAAATASGDMTVYTVKAGDMLGRIAKSHGTTVAKIKALNDLKSTSIRVGQKLKLPVASNPKPTPEPSSNTATASPTASMTPIYATSQPAVAAR